MKVEINDTVTTNIKTIKILAYCRDSFNMRLVDDKGNTCCDYNDYVPDFLTSSFGDCLDLTIDIETGQILNWPKITKMELENFINNVED